MNQDVLKFKKLCKILEKATDYYFENNFLKNHSLLTVSRMMSNEIIYLKKQDIESVRTDITRGLGNNLLHSICMNTWETSDADFAIKYILPVLFASGIDIDEKNKGENTALSEACKAMFMKSNKEPLCGKDSLTVALINQGACLFNSKVSNNSPLQPFSHACASGMIKSVELMLINGVSPDDYGHQENSGYALAKKHQQYNIITMLEMNRNYNAVIKMNKNDNKKTTPVLPLRL